MREGANTHRLEMIIGSTCTNEWSLEAGSEGNVDSNKWYRLPFMILVRRRSSLIIQPIYCSSFLPSLFHSRNRLLSDRKSSKLKI